MGIQYSQHDHQWDRFKRNAEQNMDFSEVFIDLTKACDTITRKILLAIHTKLSFSRKKLIHPFHDSIIDLVISSENLSMSPTESNKAVYYLWSCSMYPSWVWSTVWMAPSLRFNPVSILERPILKLYLQTAAPSLV